MDISIIICCYNSSNKIVPTLEHISALKCSKTYELIVIDNNCTDDTVSIVTKTWSNFSNSIPFSIQTESLPGLSNARKKGIIHAKGKYIVFCDDDNWLSESYLEAAFERMESDPEIGALCGYNQARFNIDIPNIVAENLGSFACGHDGLKSGELPKSIVPWGAGLVVQRQLMTRIIDSSFRSYLSDRTGNELSSGGDTEYCLILRLLGYKWFYDTDLYLTHDLPVDRLNFDYLKKLHFGFGKANFICQWYYFYGELSDLRNSKSTWLKLLKDYWFTWAKMKAPKNQHEELRSVYTKGFKSQFYSERKVYKTKKKTLLLLVNELTKLRDK